MTGRLIADALPSRSGSGHDTPGTALAALIHPYASLGYAESLGHVGTAHWVEGWRSAVLLREIPNSGGLRDACGAYPVSTLPADADLPRGLGQLRDLGAVSLVLVTDPCQDGAADALARHFPVYRAFKTHYLIDRAGGPVEMTKHHRDRVRRAARHGRVRIVALRDSLDTWCELYAGLIRKHGIVGAAAFPCAAFAALARCPGLTCLVCETPDGAVLAMQLWLRHGEVAYSHLTATSPAGYKLLATYALYAAAIEHFADCRLLDFGGGAGIDDDAENSLARFKQGFSNASRVAYLCGSILDPCSYRQLTAGRTPSNYFPAYRGSQPGDQAPLEAPAKAAATDTMSLGE